MIIPKFDPFASYADNIIAYAFETKDHPFVDAEELLVHLNCQEKIVFECYAKNHMSQTEISLITNKSQMWIHHILERSFRKIKYAAENIIHGEKLKNEIDNLSKDFDDPKFIDYLCLSRRSYNCLYRARLLSFNQIKKAIEEGTLLNIRNLGIVCLKEITEKFNAKSKEIFGNKFTEDVKFISDTKEVNAYKVFSEIGLSVSAINALIYSAEVFTIEELIESFKTGELFDIDGLGFVTYKIIHKYIFENNYLIAK